MCFNVARIYIKGGNHQLGDKEAFYQISKRVVRFVKAGDVMVR